MSQRVLVDAALEGAAGSADASIANTGAAIPIWT
jgi:hypothetical protein